MADFVEWFYVPAPGVRGDIVAWFWCCNGVDSWTRIGQTPRIVNKGETIRAATESRVDKLRAILLVERNGTSFELGCEMMRIARKV